MKFLKNTLIHFIIFLSILFLVFRDLLIHISTNLIDWRDYSLMVWIVSINAQKLLNLNFLNYFDTNTFFPHKYALLFSDLLIPQAVISLPLYLFSNNLILIFNCVFILTFILNFFSSYIFWRLLFKNNLIAFFGSILVVFSPFFHLNLDHFQMLSFWPFFLSLYYLFKFKEDKHTINIFLSGIFLAIQFLASVYLATFLIFIHLIFFVVNLMFLKEVKYTLRNLIIILFVFLALDGVFIKGYIDTKEHYQVTRDLGEYINYSAHITDYFFTQRINSFIHNSSFLDKWNKFDKNFLLGKASFPGFLLTFLALYSLIKFTRKPGKIIFSLQFNITLTFFLLFIVFGLIFSLGPRVNFNGEYAYIPLPYSILLKIGGPVLESVRGPARWSFIFYVGIIYFTLLSLEKFKEKKYIFIVFFLLFILEYIPLNLVTEKGDYISTDSTQLKSLCINEKKTLLEIPITHLHATNDIASGLTYINRVQLESIYHQCNLVNGYSGYDLPENFNLADKLNLYIESQQIEEFTKELRMRKIELVKFNQSYFPKQIKPKVSIFVNKFSNQRRIKKINQDLFLLQR